MFVLLRTLLVGHVHPLAGQLAARQLADAGDDHRQRLDGIAGDELGAVVVGVGSPRLDEAGEVLEEQVAGDGEIGAAAVGVVGGRVVGDRSFARTVGGQVLAPEEELDGVPAGGDVGLAALLVERREQLGVDRRVGVGVVDDAGRRVALDVVDVGLVERPGVDQTFGSVSLVVDRTAVEAERLGQAVVVACRQPRLLGGLQRLVRRVGEERIDRGIEFGRRLERCLVRRVHSGGVVVDHRLGVVVARAGQRPGQVL